MACWTTHEVDPLGRPQQVTRCRLAGGEIIDFRDDWEVPVDLRPNLGIDAVGPCWFLTSRATPYVIVEQYAGGDAMIGYIPDPSEPGTWVAVENYRRCTSEPESDSDRETRVWDYAHSYIHRPPTPQTSPNVGDGVTGLATYLQVAVPEPHHATLSGGTTSLEVEIEVAAVRVNWGDRNRNDYPPDPNLLRGFPGGAVWHIYQTKSDQYDIAVSYLWSVRWRAGSGPWNTLVVPPTTTVLAYPVSEIVSVLDGG